MSHLGIIGSGPSAIFLLKHLSTNLEHFRSLSQVSIFEKASIAGMGMPYSPETTDLYNVSNISSDEIPELGEPLVTWLRNRNDDELESWNIERDEIDESSIYGRLVLGEYFRCQYLEILRDLRLKGLEITELCECEVIDIQELSEDGKLQIICRQGGVFPVDTVVIASGHDWPNDDKPEYGYHASPWPIQKLLPEDTKFHNHPIGILGASLSAFDVVSSLSHRHGTFTRLGNELVYKAHNGTESFKIILHAADGKLPHLQFDQLEPFRKIYRHTHREQILSLLDRDGFLRLESFFQTICKPALIEAFNHDGLQEIADVLSLPSVSIVDFVERLSEMHSYTDPFEGMRLELAEARKSVLHHQPIRWKEVLDDLMYTLNFHASALPAEDHILLRKVVMPFQMNVIAAMPLESAEKLLALHDAGKVEVVAGKVTIPETQDEKGITQVTVEDGDEKTAIKYQMFVDCGGQRPVELSDLPFPSLIETKNVALASAKFKDTSEIHSDLVDETNRNKIICDRQGHCQLEVGGIAIDDSYRLVGQDGTINSRIYNLAFPHVSGLRPYSYGLQACNETSKIVVMSWIHHCDLEPAAPITLEMATNLYKLI